MERNIVLITVFHWIWHLRWVPNVTKIETNNMKSTWPTPAPRGTQHDLYSICLRWGFALGVTKIVRVCVGGNANLCVFRYQHPKCKIFSRWGYCPMRTPNVRGFVLQWNIGLKVHLACCLRRAYLAAGSAILKCMHQAGVPFFQTLDMNIT